MNIEHRTSNIEHRMKNQWKEERGERKEGKDRRQGKDSGQWSDVRGQMTERGRTEIRGKDSGPFTDFGSRLFSVNQARRPGCLDAGRHRAAASSTGGASSAWGRSADYADYRRLKSLAQRRTHEK